MVVTASAGDGAGITPLRRLTRLEYSATIRDLLGDASRPGDAFPDDTRGINRFTVGGVVSVVDARAYYDAAKTIATTAMPNLGSLLACDPAKTGEAACADSFIQKFGKRAYRRPLSPEEGADLTGLYQWARTQPGYTFTDGIRVVLQAMLQSPNFMYHQEVGTTPAADGDLVHLTPYEVASRLSYFLWSSMPDDPLLAEADQNRLATPEQLDAQARRLLNDGRAAETLRSFHTDWLDLDQLAVAQKDGQRFPEFTDTLRASMQAETPAFVNDVFMNDGRLETLLTAGYSFVDATLANVYGLAAPVGQGLHKVTLDPTQHRAGLLTQLGFLTTAASPSSTSPIRRGKFIRERMLCQDLPPPPPNVNTTPPAPDPNVPARQQFLQHSNDAACSGCHSLMDPIGFAFENFDSIGRFRSTDGGQPVDASGEIKGSTSSDGKFNGVAELAAKLAQSDDVRHCISQQWFRFALGRMEGPADEKSLQLAFQGFASRDFDIRELLVALTQTNGFLLRTAAPGEVKP